MILIIINKVKVTERAHMLSNVVCYPLFFLHFRHRILHVSSLTFTERTDIQRYLQSARSYIGYILMKMATKYTHK
ncbi:uncharacterized protein METZ01_LOCUS402153 [marine metagenome]|uniref:Uncharacterized protein n=1 Tax=marine metagenome TaxID=408172 RepID=A0A382VS02_9ZZZZ